MNKKQLTPGPSFQIRDKLLAKKLSNIEEDFEMESEIRMPEITKTRKNVYHPSPIDRKLQRIISIKSKREKQVQSVQSHSNFLNTTKYESSHIRSQNLPQLTPLKDLSRNKSSLDKILSDRDIFAKAYFEELRKIEKLRKNQPEEDETVEFSFPEIKVGNWKVRGYLKQNHILLKGVHKDERICIKKYSYEKVYEKIRRDYQSWVQSKFVIQS